MKEWNGLYFIKTSLKKLGLWVQLGHCLGDICTNPQDASATFTVLDTHGIHNVSVYFCGCEKATKHTVQLLRRRWFPATVASPKTAATFRLLEHFQMLTFESKASMFEYYHSLSRLTDNSGANEHPVQFFLDSFYEPTNNHIRTDTMNCGA